MPTPDYAVIGGGIVGLTIARELAMRGGGVTVFEKEAHLGEHASGRNSGVLHAGFYYAPDSLKARLTARGNQLLRAFCAEHDVRVRSCGKVVVASTPEQLPALDELVRRGTANGVRLETVDERGLADLEPLARTVDRAIWSPDTGVADPKAVTAALQAAAPEAVRHGGFWARGAAVGIDVALAGAVIGLLGLPGLALHLAYITVVHATRGQTIGKYLLNLQVRRLDGGKLGFGRSAARTVASMWLPFLVGLVILITQGRGGLEVAVHQIQLSDVDAFKGLVFAVLLGNALLSLLYAAGLALAAFHPQKRAAHDLIVGSEVIYRLK